MGGSNRSGARQDGDLSTKAEAYVDERRLCDLLLSTRDACTRLQVCSINPRPTVPAALFLARCPSRSWSWRRQSFTAREGLTVASPISAHSLHLTLAGESHSPHPHHWHLHPLLPQHISPFSFLHITCNLVTLFLVTINTPYQSPFRASTSRASGIYLSNLYHIS